MNRFFFVLLFHFFLKQVTGQVHIISGYVQDINTGEKIIGATVYDSCTKSFTQSNSFGFYSLKIKGDKAALQSTFIGLKSEVIHLHLSRDTLINIQIQPVIELNEVIITSSLYRQNENSMLGFTAIPVNQLNLTPALGEPDLIKSIQRQPGIEGGVEGSTGIFVRGGSSGENLFMLDDVPIYNSSHLYGFFSMFNNSAIKDVKLYKGCFPARYGGRTSSIIEVRSLDGNNKAIRGEISLSLISSKISLEGPLRNSKTTFFVSGRRSYFDLYSGSFKSLNLFNLNFPGYFFYDVNFKLTHTFSENDKVYLSIFRGKDNIRYTNETTSTNSSSGLLSDFLNEISGWGNKIGSLRWNHIFGDKIFINTTLAYSNYNYFIINNYSSDQRDSMSSEALKVNYKSNYKSELSDIILKADIDYTLSNNHKLTFGFGNTFHVFNPGMNTYKVNLSGNDINADTTFSNSTLYDNEPFFYLDDDVKLSQEISLRAGIRVSGLYSKNQLLINLEPRISANYNVLPHLVIKAGYSRMVQYIHLLSSSGLSMPTDIWVPALKGLSPLKSDQINAGVSYNTKNVLLFSIEIYRKWLKNTTDYRNGAFLLSDLTPWYDKTTQGHGTSTGVEVSIEKQDGLLTGSINYAISKADRRYIDLNNGRPFPFRYDRRHDFNISANYQISKKWDVSVTWYFGTGYPVTIPVEKYTPALNIVSGVQHNLIYYYPALYNYRLPDYHRLDLGIHYKTKNRLGQHILSFDIFNAYNRKNPVNMFYMLNYSFKEIYLIPIIPSLSYTLKFNDFNSSAKKSKTNENRHNLHTGTNPSKRR